jgi:hypothetical protein
MFRRTVTTLAVAAASGIGALALAPAAHAADGTTIEASSNIVAFGEPISFTGTCAAPATTGVVTVTQNGEVVGSTTVNASGVFVSSVTTTNVVEGPASLELSCLTYAGGAPVSSAATGVLVFNGGIELIPVEVSPTTVAIGQMSGVKATCPEGSTRATIMVGGAEAENPFYTAEIGLGSSLYVELPLPIVASGTGPEAIAPEPGPAMVVVTCEGANGEPTGIGSAELTITAGPIAPPPVPVVVATDGPAKAQDGASVLPLGAAALALGLVAAGGATVARRKAQAHSRR